MAVCEGGRQEVNRVHREQVIKLLNTIADALNELDKINPTIGVDLHYSQVSVDYVGMIGYDRGKWVYSNF